MGDGAGQFTCRRETVDGKFRHALSRLHFGKLAPTILTSEAGDQPSMLPTQ